MLFGDEIDAAVVDDDGDVGMLVVLVMVIDAILEETSSSSAELKFGSSLLSAFLSSLDGNMFRRSFAVAVLRNQYENESIN